MLQIEPPIQSPNTILPSSSEVLDEIPSNFSIAWCNDHGSCNATIVNNQTVANFTCECDFTYDGEVCAHSWGSMYWTYVYVYTVLFAVIALTALVQLVRFDNYSFDSVYRFGLYIWMVGSQRYRSYCTSCLCCWV
jgi:hypothetical protein